MADIVYCEWLKLKRSKILLIGFTDSFIVPFLVTVNDIRISFSNPDAPLSLGVIYEDTIMFIMLLFMLLSWLDIIVITMVCSLFLDVEKITALSAVFTLVQMLKGGILLYATLTPFVYLALRAKGSIAPFIVIAAVSLLNVVLSGSPVAGIYPWTASYLLLTGNLSQSGVSSAPGGLIILLVYASGICASIIRFQKEDIT